MAVRYKTGNKATLALTGDLLDGITSAWVADIVSIDLGEWQLGTRDVSVLADEEFARLDPQDLATPNEITGTVRFRSDLGAPVLGQIDTATITLPGHGEASGGIIAGKAFFSRFKFPNAQNNETMDAEFTLQMTGEDLTFTPGEASGG